MAQPTIQNFVASMNKANGFARASKYAVVITPPTSLNRLIEEAKAAIMDDEGDLRSEFQKARSLTHKQVMFNQVGRQVNLHCNTVSMPGHDLQAQDVQHGSAPGRQMVQSHDYNGTIAASFYLDSHLSERHFFEKWQSMAVNKATHKAEYYDDYIGSMEIYQLDGDGKITYGIKAIEVYPTTIAGIEYAYASANTIALQSVNFQYRQWFNMTSDDIAGYKTRINDEWSTAESQLKTIRAVEDKLASERLSNTSAQREKARLRQLRPPEIDRQDTNRKSAQQERDRQNHLRPPEVDKSVLHAQIKQHEEDRQKHLKKPEVDIDRHAANRKSAARQKRLRPPLGWSQK